MKYDEEELVDEINRLEAEVKRLETKYHVDMNNYRSQVQTWQEQYDKRIVNLEKQNAELAEALRFYADTNNYKHDYINPPEVFADGGDKASKVLRKHGFRNEL